MIEDGARLRRLLRDDGREPATRAAERRQRYRPVRMPPVFGPDLPREAVYLFDAVAGCVMQSLGQNETPKRPGPEAMGDPSALGETPPRPGELIRSASKGRRIDLSADPQGFGGGAPSEGRLRGDTPAEARDIAIPRHPAETDTAGSTAEGAGGSIARAGTDAEPEVAPADEAKALAGGSPAPDGQSVPTADSAVSASADHGAFAEAPPASGWVVDPQDPLNLPPVPPAFDEEAGDRAFGDMRREKDKAADERLRNELLGDPGRDPTDVLRFAMSGATIPAPGSLPTTIPPVARIPDEAEEQAAGETLPAALAPVRHRAAYEVIPPAARARSYDDDIEELFFEDDGEAMLPILADDTLPDGPDENAAPAEPGLPTVQRMEPQLPVTERHWKSGSLHIVLPGGIEIIRHARDDGAEEDGPWSGWREAEAAEASLLASEALPPEALPERARPGTGAAGPAPLGHDALWSCAGALAPHVPELPEIDPAAGAAALLDRPDAPRPAATEPHLHGPAADEIEDAMTLAPALPGPHPADIEIDAEDAILLDDDAPPVDPRRLN